MFPLRPQTPNIKQIPEHILQRIKICGDGDGDGDSDDEKSLSSSDIDCDEWLRVYLEQDFYHSEGFSESDYQTDEGDNDSIYYDDQDHDDQDHDDSQDYPKKYPYPITGVVKSPQLNRWLHLGRKKKECF